MLAKAGTESILGSTRYQYEQKLDGQRCLVYVSPDGVTLQSRTGRDISANFPEIVFHLSKRVWTSSHVFDGEIVVLKDGREDFQALSTRMQRITSVGEHSLKTRAEFTAFDVLVSYDRDITDWSLSKRRETLEHYVATNSPFDITRVIPPSEILATYDTIKAEGREGVMAKLLTSPYRWGERSDEWLKIKPIRSMEVYIGGCTWGLGRRSNDFAALLVGTRLDQDVGLPNISVIRYLGSVGTGFNDAMLRDLRILIEDRECAETPFIDYPTTTPQANNVRAYCTPTLKARIEYQELTNDGKLRFPAFKELLQ